MGDDSGALMNRCVVKGAATVKGGVYPPIYQSLAYFDAGAVGSFGEWDMWCAVEQVSLC